MATENENKTPSVEELNATIKELQSNITQLKGDLEKQKQATSNASTDAAEWKKKFRDTQDEGTRRNAETEETIAALRNELASLKKNETISGYEKSYLALGYDSALARSTAEAMADGNMSVVFENQKAFTEAQKKAVQENALNNMPDLSKGKNPAPPSSEDDKLVAAFSRAVGVET